MRAAGGCGARPAGERQRALRVPLQRRVEERVRFGGAAGVDQHFGQQLRRRLDRLGQSERRRERRFLLRGGAEDRERSVASACEEGDARRDLALHDRDRGPQVALPRGAHADREQLVGVAERALAREQVPARRFHDVARAHGRQIAQQRQLTAVPHDRLDLVERRARVPVASELQQLVLPPGQRVVAAKRRRQSLTLYPRVRRRIGGRVGRLRVLPRTELDEDVRRHVARMARVGREPREREGGGERRAGVPGVVIVVQHVMQGAGMGRVGAQHALQDSVHLPLRVAAGQRAVVAFV